MEIGIVGLPNVGKSSLFNALTKAQVPAENFPFTTIQPNVGVVPVPDPRLDFLARLYNSPKVVPANVRFVDIAGLVPGASKGEGLGNQFLSHIREVDAIAQVVRCFESAEVVNVMGSLGPKRDAEVITTELILADLEQAQKAREKYTGAARTGDEEAKKRLAFLDEVAKGLNQGIPVRKMKTEAAFVRDYSFLTAKPVLYVANVNEKTPAGLWEEVQAWAKEQKASAIQINVKLEGEIVSLSPEEQEAYRSELGIHESGLGVLARAGQDLLKQITFFTAGPKESHAWNVIRGDSIVKAAGKIHSDMEKGFIRAEIFNVKDLEIAGTEAAVRAAGKVRMEGRDYLTQDGDIVVIHFKA